MYERNLIQLHGRKKGEPWGVRNAFIDENKEVMMREINPDIPPGSRLMTRAKLWDHALHVMSKWRNSGGDWDTEFRVIETKTLDKQLRAAFEAGR